MPRTHVISASRRRAAQILCLLWLLPPAGVLPQTPPPPLRVFAAASLTDVLGELSTRWEKSSGVPVKLSFAASSILARQIEAGGAADVFISADQEWMDYLAQRGHLARGSQRVLAGNRLVLIAPATRTVNLSLAHGVDLTPALAGGRLATADPDTVPAGRYARAALTSLGIWTSLEPRLARAENVRVALLYVARGEAPLGIVYATDAALEPRVQVIATFPEDSHPRITYPAAVLADAGRGAAAYLEFLAGADAAAVWRKYGFRETSR